MILNGAFDLGLLGQELTAAGISVPFGLTAYQPQNDGPIEISQVVDAQGGLADLPPGAAPVLAAHHPPAPQTRASLVAAVKSASTLEELRSATAAALEAV